MTAALHDRPTWKLAEEHRPGGRRAVAAELAVAAEHLQRAALAVLGLGHENSELALIWSRQVDDLLEQSLAYHEEAYAQETGA